MLQMLLVGNNEKLKDIAFSYILSVNKFEVISGRQNSYSLNYGTLRFLAGRANEAATTLYIEVLILLNLHLISLNLRYNEAVPNTALMNNCILLKSQSPLGIVSCSFHLFLLFISRYQYVKANITLLVSGVLAIDNLKF